MLEGLLPIGSVVLLKESTKKIMIIGVCQNQIDSDDSPKLWDYAACLFPEGYLGADRTFLFNSDQIEKVFALGYQDEEQLVFKTRADAALNDLRGGGNGNA